ncbi:MAG: hypothetical protein ABI472_04740 [Ginsengibacter sp.]
MRKAKVILFVTLFFCVSCFSQNVKMEDKIDPAFTSLITKQKIKIDTDSEYCASRTTAKTTHCGTSKNFRAAEKYECIVYTKNAGLLRDKGIIVNSTLPTFVTALATLKQIVQMASMPEVTYIEAPKINTPKL